MSLDRLISAARDTDPSWDDARAKRVLGSALGRRDRRAARDRLLRRGAVAGSMIAVVCLVVLRAASASGPTPSSIDVPVDEPVAAARALDDAGYARD